MALSRASIVDAALGILDRYGLGDLSMRRLADALGVQPGALYYHIANKQQLLAAVADELLGSLGDAPTLAAWAAQYRKVLLGHRDAAELVASSRATKLGVVDPTAGVRALLPESSADAVLATFEHFILGATMSDQTRAQLHALGILPSFDEEGAERAFEDGIEILTRGTRIFIDPVA